MKPLLLSLLLALFLHSENPHCGLDHSAFLAQGGTPPISECPEGQHHDTACVAGCQATRTAALAEAQSAWDSCYDDGEATFNSCMSAAQTNAQRRACVNQYDATMLGCNETKNAAVAQANADFSACASACPCVPD